MMSGVGMASGAGMASGVEMMRVRESSGLPPARTPKDASTATNRAEPPIPVRLTRRRLFPYHETRGCCAKLP